MSMLDSAEGELHYLGLDGARISRKWSCSILNCTSSPFGHVPWGLAIGPDTEHGQLYITMAREYAVKLCPSHLLLQRSFAVIVASA